MTTRTINGNNAGNTIKVLDFSAIAGSGYKVTGASSISPAGSAPFFDTDLVINTFDATGGTDVVDLSGLTTNSGVTFTSITINGGGGTQIVTGSEFAETISTGSGNDTINAGAGNDTLIGGDGADSMDGGDGSDTYNIAGLFVQVGGDTLNDTGAGITDTDTINVTGVLSGLSLGVAGTNYSLINGLLPTAAGATYQGIEIFDGNNFAITGNNNGSDIFDLSGFSSATQVGAINTANATGGTDYVNVSTADAGVAITGGGGTQIVVGSGFADTISTGSGNDTINAGADNDTITGGDGADSMDGGDGDDIFNIAGLQVGGDTIIGGGGNDTIRNTSASALGISSFGPSGSGTAATYSSIETLDGNNQAINGTNATNEVVNLSLIGQVLNVTGVNMLDGADTVWTAASHSGLVVTDYDGGGSGSTPQDTINLVLTALQLGAFSVTDINTLNNYVAAPTNKTLGPSGGTNNITSLEFKARRFELATANVLDDGQVYNITDCLVGIDNVVAVTPTQTTINGTANNDLIVGNGLNNTINGLAGKDLIFGGAGNDTIKGGAGNDCLFGDAGDDTFRANLNEAEFDDLQGGSGIDTLQRTTDGGQGNLVLNQFLATNGIEQVNLGAGGQNKTIVGNASANVLDFSATTLLSVSGSLSGEGGNDTITATNSATYTYDGGAGNDVLNGGSLADNLIGGTGDDTISGGGGNDTIVGGADADRLTGGGGSDRFVIKNASEGIDTITDFDPTATTGDLFNVSSNGFSFAAIGGPGTLAATRFTIGTVATAASHRFIYDIGSGNLWFDSDGTGGASQVQIAQLTNYGSIAPLSHTNFIIVN